MSPFLLRMTQLPARAPRIGDEAYPRGPPRVVDPRLVLVLTAAALLRLLTMGQQSFWLDEAATLNVLHRSFGGMFAAIVHHESTPPLYYILAWAWAHVSGHSKAGVRSLSAWRESRRFGWSTCARG